MRIEIPEIAVVALVGVSGSGKTTFANAHFKATEILSSDHFRALISDDENNQKATPQAFDALYYVASKRLELGLTTVIDATNVQREARTSVLNLAKEQNCPAVAIVLDTPEKICRERNQQRPGKGLDNRVISHQARQLQQSIKSLRKEGFRYVFVLKSEEEAAGAEIVRVPLWNNKKSQVGPFDIIGDIHGCYEELIELLSKLGYAVSASSCTAIPPERRKAVFLGDLCDRGPRSADVLRLVMSMVRAGSAWCVAGNHDVKLLKRLRGADVQLDHGLDKTVEQLGAESGEFVADVKSFLDGLISHYVFDGGRLVVAHAGLKEKYQGRGSARVRDFCLYGDTTGEIDEYGLPVRVPWADDYRGEALVVYGHTPVPDVQAINNTICIDTGCVFGGRLTSYRYPEKEVVQVNARQEYCVPVRPFRDRPIESDDLPSVDDVLGQKHLSTRLRHSIKIDAESSAAALEVMSRFAADPHWLIYLPPTMSPCETSVTPEYLEYPAEAFDYYRTRGVGEVVCERKHMGSRTVIVLCRDADTAAKRFGVKDGSFGIIYTRTGRHFFDDPETETAMLTRLQRVLTASRFWEDFGTGWVCLDTELMPWSAKARKLLEDQYAPVGRAGRTGLRLAVEAIEKAVRAFADASAHAEVEPAEESSLSQILARCKEREGALSLYTDAYRRYCWDVETLEDYRIAPFHILATEDRAWNDKGHIWHMETIAKYMTAIDPVFVPTDYLPVTVLDENSVAAGIQWWKDLIASGGEGMVVKPLDFVVTKGSDLLQPAVKCRGREYLRIIYGPEYTLDGNMEQLRKRSLSKKRNLALNEFALGMESLERFVRREPLFRVHECVFGVLALESEPVDPRL